MAARLAAAALAPERLDGVPALDADGHGVGVRVSVALRIVCVFVAAVNSMVAVVRVTSRLTEGSTDGVDFLVMVLVEGHTGIFDIEGERMTKWCG